MKGRNNIKLRRAMVIILVLFGVFMSTGVFVLFRTSVKHDLEQSRIMGLTGEVEKEILRSGIWVEEILLTSDDRPLKNLHESIFQLNEQLHELGDFVNNENVKYRKGNLKRFRSEYDQILETFSDLKVHIADDTDASLVATDKILLQLFDEFSSSYNKFNAILPDYLILDEQRYRKELLGIMILNTLIIIISGMVILKLTHRVVQADRDLIKNTVEVESRERERIAADLHDGLGAILSGLMIHIQVLQKRNEANNDHSLSSDLSHLQSLVKNALDGIEEIINNLSPSELLRHGLIDSVKRVVTRINRAGQTAFRVESYGQPLELGHHKELLVYRIICELINNTLKHAKALDANIKFVVQNRTLTLEYQDNGKGFEYNHYILSLSKDGLKNIVHRIESMEGSYSFSNNADQGMHVKISIPTGIS